MKKRLASFLSAALMVLAMVVSVVPANAATSSSTDSSDAGAAAVTSSGLNIDPRKNYTINPGDTVTDTLNVGNLDTQASLDLSVKLIDFTYSDTSGTPKLLMAANAPQTPWSLKPFATLPSSISVGPHSSGQVKLTISIPKGQGAGSYYGAIVYSTGDSNDADVTKVGMSASGVTLIFVSIPGTVNENMTLQKFGAYARNTKAADAGQFLGIATSKPTELAYTLLNTGNVAEEPVGTIDMRSMWGGKDIIIQNANPFSSLALRGQTRLFVACINQQGQAIDLSGTTSSAPTCANPKLIPGRYTMKLDIFYGQNGNQTHEITQVATFWYLPWWFIIGLLVAIAVIAGFVWWLKNKVVAIVNGARPKQFRR